MSRAYDNAADGRYQQGGRRNLIINGAMEVAQRGTSVTGVTSSTVCQTVDRWALQTSGATMNMSQEALTVGQTDIPSQFKYFLRADITTGNNFAGIFQAIENVDTVSGETVTVSFYAKGTNPGGGDVDVRIRQYFGSGGSTQVDLATQAIVLTSSWTRYVLSFDLPSISGKTIGTSSFIQLAIIQAAGDNSTDAWTLDITGVQLEVGNVATPFEHRSFGEELALCQRYFYLFNPTSTTIFPATRAGSSTISFSIPTPVTLRSAPTYTTTNQTAFVARGGGNNAAVTATSFSNDAGNIVTLVSTVGFVPSASEAYGVYASSAGDHYFDSEL